MNRVAGAAAAFVGSIVIFVALGRSGWAADTRRPAAVVP
jgi:hypothetical protein